MKTTFAAILVGLVLCLVVTELIGQLFYFVVVKRQFDSVQDLAFFYLRKSANQDLGYELKPRINLVRDDKLLKINRLGIREASDSLQKSKPRVGLIGDSVVFGINQSQDSTLSELIEDACQDSVQVLNLGVPGYATAQIVVQYEKYQPLYRFDEVIYLLNLNDFTTRNSVYEGADNGVYRYFNPPRFKSLWFLRKLIYRIRKKGEVSFNCDYYRWAYEGTKDEIFAKLLALKAEVGSKFSVVILPSGVAYRHGNYELADMVNEIEQFLACNAITCLNPVNDFGQNTNTLIDETDHLTIAGNQVMARKISTLLSNHRPQTERLLSSQASSRSVSNDTN